MTRTQRSTLVTTAALIGLMLLALGAYLLATSETRSNRGGSAAASREHHSLFASQIGLYDEQVTQVSEQQALGIDAFPFSLSFLNGSSAAAMADSATQIADRATRLHARLVAPFNMLPDAGVSADQAAAGAMNATARSFARSLIDAGQAHAIIRIGWEMNGSWFPWGTESMTPGQFLRIWSQEVATMKAVPGQHFLFFWNPTIDAHNTCSQWLPPPGEVDIVGLDVFDQTNGAWPGPVAAWQSYRTAPCGLNYIVTTARQRHLQIGLGEWGLGYLAGSNGGDDPYFVERIAQWSETNHLLFATLWNDGNVFFGGSNPLAVEALRAAMT